MVVIIITVIIMTSTRTYEELCIWVGVRTMYFLVKRVKWIN